MIKCPNCGTMNEPGSSFCFQCGSDIRNVANSAPEQPPAGFPPTMAPPGFPPPPSGFPSAPQPPGFPPPPQQPGFPPQYPSPQGFDPARQGWTPGYMTPPDEPRRRRWLWVTLGLIFGCILLCVVGSILISTSDTVADLATSISEFSTEEAGN